MCKRASKWFVWMLSIGAQLTPIAFSRPAASSDMGVFSMYSDLCRDQRTGDITGDRVIIVRLDKDYVLYQSGTGGGISQPVFVPVVIRSGRLDFTVDVPDLFSGAFSGTVTASRLVGEFKNAHGEKLGFDGIALPRKESLQVSSCH